MKRVLLLATTTGYQIRAFGEAAAALGVRLLFASDRCERLEDPWWDGAIAVRFHDLPTSMDAVLAVTTDHAIDGVLAVGDRPTVLAARLTSALGLPGNPPGAAEASCNKLASRAAFAQAGLLTPAFQVLSIADDTVGLPDMQYPLVVKPLALSGSRGVMRVDDEQQLRTAIDRLRRLLRSADIAIQRDPVHEQMLVESFIPGREFAVEGVLTDGAMQVFAIFDKPDPLDGPYFEETIYLTPSRASSSTQRAIVEAVAVAAKALGLRHGPVHAECRVNERGVYVLEVAARPIGGLCSRVLRFDAGDGRPASLEEILLRHAMGEPVSRYQLAAESAGVMMIPIPGRGVYKGVSGVEDAALVPGIEDIRITAKPDAVLVPLPEGRSYLGFIFARGGTPDDVERALRAAHGRLAFRIDRDLAVICT